MSRNITAAQKRAWKFYKSDALAQTNKESMTAFCMEQRDKKKFSRDLKVEQKQNSWACFLKMSYCSFITQWKYSEKNIQSSWGSQKKFF